MTEKKRLIHLLALLMAPLGALAAPLAPDPLYSLSVFPEGFSGTEINNAGQVVGTYNDAAAIWSGSGLVSLTSIAPGSVGYAINDNGDTAGTWNNTLFTYAGGVFTDIGRPPGSDLSRPFAINDAGQVAGDFIGPGYNRGYLYSGGQYQVIGTLSGTGNSFTSGLNNRGQVVGWSTVGPSGTAMHAIVYENGGLRDLGTLPGDTASNAQDINDRGQIAGSSGRRPALFADGRIIDISDPRDTFGEVNAINNLGQAVGTADYVGEGFIFHGFLYANGRNLDLNALLTGADGWRIENTLDINDAGQILALGCQFATCTTVLLSPVPEPSSGVMLVVGLVLLRGRGKRPAPSGAGASCSRGPTERNRHDHL